MKMKIGAIYDSHNTYADDVLVTFRNLADNGGDMVGIQIGRDAITSDTVVVRRKELKQFAEVLGRNDDDFEFEVELPAYKLSDSGVGLILIDDLSIDTCNVGNEAAVRIHIPVENEVDRRVSVKLRQFVEAIHLL